MTDQETPATETEAFDDDEVVSRRISIPNIDPDLVVEAMMELGLVSGRVYPVLTFYEGDPIRTVDIEFESADESIFPILYELGKLLGDKVDVMIADGEIWENTRALAGAS